MLRFTSVWLLLDLNTRRCGITKLVVRLKRGGNCIIFSLNTLGVLPELRGNPLRLQIHSQESLDQPSKAPEKEADDA